MINFTCSLNHKFLLVYDLSIRKDMYVYNKSDSEQKSVTIFDGDYYP